MVQYFKSLSTKENIPQTRTCDPQTNTKYTCQTIDDIFHSKTLKPNTMHNQLGTRLCVSRFTEEYSGAYRPEGIVFDTVQEPDYVSPIDVMALTDGKSFTSSDNDSKPLPEHNLFLFDDFEEMTEKFPNPEKAVMEVNRIRKYHGLNEIANLAYNECCFKDLVKIKPIAIIGQSDEMKKTATAHNIPIYNTLTEYMHRKPTVYENTKKSIVGAIYRVGASFAIDGLVYLAWTGGSVRGFIERFQLDKFAIVTAAVVGINFLDYKFDITNRLDRMAANIGKGFRRAISR